jgi:hypothetical protein
VRLFYSRSGELPDGFARRNPRHFGGAAEPNVERVLIDGDWPAVTEAYVAAGVPVEQLVPADAPAPAPVVENPTRFSLSPEARAEVEIPDAWRELPWVGPSDAMTLRSLGARLSDKPVLNKAQAAAAIEAELQRRAAAPPQADEGPAEPSPPAE